MNYQNPLAFNGRIKQQHPHDTVTLTWEAEVASSAFLSSLILRNRGNLKDIPFSGSTCNIYKLLLFFIRYIYMYNM